MSGNYVQEFPIICLDSSRIATLSSSIYCTAFRSWSNYVYYYQHNTFKTLNTAVNVQAALVVCDLCISDFAYMYCDWNFGILDKGTLSNLPKIIDLS
jgi:hypothetical protein